jgi:hypothetical protein
MWDTWTKSLQTFDNAAEQAGNLLTMMMAQSEMLLCTPR